jgi:hypothetical protein
MELLHDTCQSCRRPIERLDAPGGSWFHSSPNDSDACLSIGLPSPGPAECETCGMTAHPGADCPMVAGQ